MKLAGIKRLHNAFLREGVAGFAKLVLTRLQNTLIRWFFQLIAWPFAILLMAISPWIKIRLMLLFSDRVGHYPFNTEVLLCALDKNISTNKPCITWFYTVPGEPICNLQMHRMWKRTLTILPFPRVVAEIDNLLLNFGPHWYKSDSIKRFFSPRGDANDRWDLLQHIQEPHTTFTADEETKGAQLLQQLGIPVGAKFICLLARDPHYLNQYRPNNNWSYHDYRDVSINNYAEAALYLAEKGYYVLRMGKVVKSSFSLAHPNVIDYANHPLRSDFLDIYLSAKCYFFISSSTGLDAVAKLFRRPLLITNYPLSDLDPGIQWRALFIPKKIVDINHGRTLKFKEIYTIFSGSLRQKNIVTIAQEQNLKFVENTPAEITDAVKEMLDRLENGTFYSAAEEDLQSLFWQQAPDKLPSFLPSLKVAATEGKGSKMRISTNFLKRNLELLHENTLETMDGLT